MVGRRQSRRYSTIGGFAVCAFSPPQRVLERFTLPQIAIGQVVQHGHSQLHCAKALEPRKFSAPHNTAGAAHHRIRWEIFVWKIRQRFGW
jgi:hypothetical protein